MAESAGSAARPPSAHRLRRGDDRQTQREASWATCWRGHAERHASVGASSSMGSAAAFVRRASNRNGTELSCTADDTKYANG